MGEGVDVIEKIMPEWPIKDASMTRGYEDAWMSDDRCSWFAVNPSTTLKVNFHGDFNQNAFDSLVRWLAKAGYIKKPLRPERVIFNPPATIAFWNDGTKTVAKAKGGDEYDPLFGIMACALRKVGKNRVTIDSWEPVIDFLSSYLADAKECRAIADMLNTTADALELDGVMDAMEEYDERNEQGDERPESHEPSTEERVENLAKGVDGFISFAAKATNTKPIVNQDEVRQVVRDLIDKGEL